MASSRKPAAPDFPLPPLSASNRIGVGFSGGLDSTVLLHLLAVRQREMGFHLAAIHVHHGLSPHANAWAQHCQQRCDALQVPLTIARVMVTPGDRGLEAASRTARMATFADFVQAHSLDGLMLAQHRDDQAETVLFRLLRGAGSRGLSGMQPESVQGGMRLWRPWLNTPRAELRDWAIAHQLTWIEDESNQDPRHTRNWLRNEILPPLRQRFPAVEAVLTRTAAQLAEDAALLDALAEMDAAAVCNAAGQIQTRSLSKLPEPRARNLLRHWLAGQGIHLDRARLDDLLRQALSERDAHPRIQIGSRHLIRQQGVLAWTD